MTIDFLATMNDLTKGGIPPYIPIAKSYKRLDQKTGELLYEVTESELYEIAENMSKQDGVDDFSRISCWHVNSKTPAKDWSPIYGCSTNPHALCRSVATLNGVLNFFESDCPNPLIMAEWQK